MPRKYATLPRSIVTAVLLPAVPRSPDAIPRYQNTGPTAETLAAAAVPAQPVSTDGMYLSPMIKISHTCTARPGNLQQHRPGPVTDSDFHKHGPAASARFELGLKLFFDKLLSGNRNIASATCHHAMTDTGDWLSLPVGEGVRGLGPARNTGSGADAIHERGPRNAPPVFNPGSRTFTVMFHDGRLEQDPVHPSGFRTQRRPAGGLRESGDAPGYAHAGEARVIKKTCKCKWPGQERIHSRLRGTQAPATTIAPEGAPASNPGLAGAGP
jgi:hypothetical protein